MERIPFSQVKFSMGNNGMSPAGSFATSRNLEDTYFFETLWIGGDKRHGSILVAEVEVVIGSRDAGRFFS